MVKMPVTIISAVFLCLFAVESNAAYLKSPYVLETAQVLPSGVRNPRLLNFIMTVGQKWNDEGSIEPIGQRLNKPITWNDLLEAQQTQVDKDLVQSIVNDLELQNTTGPGRVTGLVETYANVVSPILAWGINERLTLAAVVPVVSIDVSVDTGFVRSEEGTALINEICSRSPEKCNEAAAKLNDATQRKLARLNYEPLSSYSVNGIGDVRLVGKYSWENNAQNSLTSKLELWLPTGTEANANRALDVTTGEGRFQLGTRLIYDRWLFNTVLLSTYGGYMAMLPYQVTKRLPTSATDSLSEDKRVLTQDLGHKLEGSLRLAYPIPSTGLTVSAGYTYQFQSGSQYSDGAAAEGNRIAYLSDLEQTQQLHAATTSLTFSTVEWYKTKQFFLPLQANLIYSYPFAGRNVPNNEIISGEMVLFF